MKCTVFVTNEDWRREKPLGPHRAVYDALRSAKHHVGVVLPRHGEGLVALKRGAELGVIWNGKHGQRGVVAGAFADAGVPLYVMERGFFDRMHYTQIDPVGFNHNASWAKCLTDPAPAEGAERFLTAWGSRPGPLRRTRGGYVLALVQVHGDSQLKDAELHHPKPFVQAIDDALPGDVELRVRAHPLADWQCGVHGRARMLEGTLADAVAGARFCVCINSNAGNEALAWGCPVLCFGPALYEMAGVAKQSRLVDLATNCQAMLDGWKPDRKKLTNYLYWLACRQWTSDEIAKGWPLEVAGLLKPKERE